MKIVEELIILACEEVKSTVAPSSLTAEELADKIEAVFHRLKSELLSANK